MENLNQKRNIKNFYKHMDKKLAKEIKKRLEEARNQQEQDKREMYFIALIAYLEGMADKILK
jgi:chromosome segregation and condensation protein ScpB